MGPKWKHNKIVETEGLLFVQEVFNGHYIFNKIDGSNDVGLDGYLEYVVGGHASGVCIAVQVKSGNSYQGAKGKFVQIKSDASHFQYWSKHSLPVAIIVYIPEDGKAYWMDITKYLRNNPHVQANGPFTIKIDKTSIFNKDLLPEFISNFASYSASFNDEWHFGRALKGLVDFQDDKTKVDSIKALFYYHRTSKESWYYLIQLFTIEKDLDIQKLLIWTMRHLISHGDIFWHKNNILPEEIRNYGKLLITKFFTLSEVKKLLVHIDERGISRGSIGQDIYALLHLLPTKIELLKRFIMEEDASEDARLWAATIVINDFQYLDLHRAIRFCNSMNENFKESKYFERFKNIKLYLEANKIIDFRG